jgi:hypothetical protein
MAISVAGRTITFFLITVAFALYLTVSLSIPVTSKLYFLSYQFNNVKGLKIGLWGSCTYDIVNGVYSAGTCTKSKVGFLVGPSPLSPTRLLAEWCVADMRGFPGRSNAAYPYVVGNLASALIMYPLAAVFSFFTMVLCIAKGDKAMDTVGLAAILGQAAMIISFILFVPPLPPLLAPY